MQVVVDGAAAWHASSGHRAQLQQLIQLMHPRVLERLGAGRQQPGRRLKLCQQAGIPLNQARVCLHRFKQFEQWRAMVGL